MNIPDGVIELTVVGVVGFVFKVVFGLIQKNETKSDEADTRLEGEIKEHGQHVRDVEERFRQNSHTHFQQTSDLAQRIAYLEARSEDK